MSQHPDVVFEAGAAYPALVSLKSALARHDWPGARAVLDAATPGSRTSLIDLAADEAPRDFLENVFRDDPADGAAGALLGAHLTSVGWNIRGSGRARNVSREQFAAFHEWLRRAEQVLIETTARCPGDPAGWSRRLTTSLGLQTGEAEFRRRYDRVAEADPHHWPAQTSMIQRLCPKWGGSWEKVHRFAHEASAAAPLGSLSGSLVAKAHIEHWFSLVVDDEAAAIAYLRTPAVRDSIYDAARRSVGAPQFRPELGWVRAANEFAFLFSELGDRGATAWLFGGLGTLATRLPWQWVRGDAVETIRARREWAR
ncbi:hypothetical protein AB0M02_27380 [Actinoplanes sp. NPDC051861]|uniref:hypothetical protein n=1 Tax=Actinoplanes sp. NPDC051861 TaxID=3155170 RepID=UPI00341E6F81